MTDGFNVYKCIDNNDNGQSTVKPTSTGTEIFETSDSYKWKFMFQIGAADRTKFLSTSYMPVRVSSGAGDPHFDVNGEIDSATVSSGGAWLYLCSCCSNTWRWYGGDCNCIHRFWRR